MGRKSKECARNLDVELPEDEAAVRRFVRGAVNLRVFVRCECAARTARCPEFAEAETVAVALEIVVAVAGTEKDLDAAVLPAWCAVVCAKASVAFGRFGDVERKAEGRFVGRAAHGNAGNCGGGGPLRLWR